MGQNVNNEAPYFSVIMNCHNSDEFLQEAIDSVFSQSFDSWEIIFFDNESTDKSSTIARKFDARLRYFYNPEKVPLGKARNLAIEKARGKYLCFLDCDDLWTEAKLTLQHDKLESWNGGREAAICYTNAMRIRENGETITPYSLGRTMVEGDVFLALMQDCFVAMSSCAVNRQVSIDHDLFREDLEIIEEWDLWIRISRSYDFCYVPEIATKIRFHDNNTSRNYLLQHSEIMDMINRVEMPNALESHRKKLRLWFRMRYLIIHTIHEIRKGVVPGIYAVVRVVGFSILHPTTTFQMVKNYMSPSMIRFFLLKFSSRKRA
ncbi:MAG: glycosyltransferase family 2 protein [Paracoccaceae bacterium]|nr:glycosyltransferase family 2 protein [Paracoccaceae bacterium]